MTGPATSRKTERISENDLHEAALSASYAGSFLRSFLDPDIASLIRATLAATGQPSAPDATAEFSAAASELLRTRHSS
jgi:hypothetical protein